MKVRQATDEDRAKGFWLTLDDGGNLWTHTVIVGGEQVHSQGYQKGYVSASLDHMYANWPGVDEPDWNADIIG